MGAGRALLGDADVGTIRTAAQDILSTPSYQMNAQWPATVRTGVDDASDAVAKRQRTDEMVQ